MARSTAVRTGRTVVPRAPGVRAQASSVGNRKRAQLDPLMRREDILNGLHSSQHIPRVIGLAMQYELNGRAD